MAKVFCDFRFLLLVAAGVFIYIQMRLFATQSEYADRLAAAVTELLHFSYKSIEAENHCTSQMRSLIDQISLQQGRIVALEGFRNSVIYRGHEFSLVTFAIQNIQAHELMGVTGIWTLSDHS
ncbi:unnamed protein product [Sphenostylis stenocarpa]|uniref:Alpha-1,3-mannosyl-glycoprotein 2-beta-N-acetylglucosaminyltransferase n=1 Tax=Sphenostylis stenocarpa TaxID=92480 RepID=A0AA86T6V7_9FABA|nr:unnamed protein product [Sphenostylis stenocarpa]